MLRSVLIVAVSDSSLSAMRTAVENAAPPDFRVEVIS